MECKGRRISRISFTAYDFMGHVYTRLCGEIPVDSVNSIDDIRDFLLQHFRTPQVDDYYQVSYYDANDKVILSEKIES